MADLGRRKKKTLDDTWKGRPIFVRKPSWHAAFKLQTLSEKSDPEEVAGAVLGCVFYEDTDEPVFASVEEVIEEDFDDITYLVQEISEFASVSTEEAEKN